MLYYWTSDSQLEEELFQLVKRRELDQKFLYMKWWADYYYKAVWWSDSKDWAQENDFHYWKQPYFDQLDKFVFSQKKWKWVLISLWCWSWYQEKRMLKKIADKWYNIDYIWNDCSREMINMAQKNLYDININKSYIYWDFTSTQFVNEINSLTKEYDYKIYAFMWCTYWNPNQTSITDSLYNILWEEDYLLLDLLSRSGDLSSDKMKLFERYRGILNNENMNKFRFSPLKRLKVPFSNGKMILKTWTEESIWAFVFNFVFEFTKKTIIKFRNEKIHCLPWEHIKLITVRNYNIDVVKSFFDDHEFKSIDVKVSEYSWWLDVTQFLFKRK